MPSLIDIRRRVRAVKSTQQITKAMKMVSSSKLRRAQERIVRSRPYAKEMLRVFNNLATRVDPSKHPLLNDDPQSGRTLLIVITADRGLCGSFNTNIIKSAVQFTLDQPKGPQGQDVALALVGPAAVWAASEGGHEGGGLISLDKSLIVQMINFLILLFILQRLLYKPFLTKMGERTAAIQNRAASGAPTSIQARSAPVRSRTAIAGPHILLSRRVRSARSMSSGRSRLTTWPQPCTPASVRPAPTAETG